MFYRVLWKLFNFLEMLVRIDVFFVDENSFKLLLEIFKLILI